MRLSDRLRRLEQRDDTGDRMTREQIEAAAAEFDRRLEGLVDRASVIDPEQARAAWHALVTGPGPSYLQRVFANMEPEDLYV